jgi:hypothetical protein
MRARSWAGRGISQVLWVERLVRLSSGIAEEGFQLRSWARISQ